MANRRFIDFPIASTSSDTDIILIWQDGLNKQTTKATLLSGLPEDLADLNDVVISGLTNGQILRYNSTTGVWENTDQGNLDLNDLNDVTIVSPSNGQVLVYNSSTSQWENSSGGYVPYVGAVTTVDLGAQQLKAGHTTLTTNGSTETLTINHTSGSGKAINVTKGGNNEGLYINKTSGSGNAATIVGTLEATTLKKTGGTSSQFLKADGSVDSTAYGTGTVTSVGLSSATSGVTIGSTPVTTSGTITLAIATASGSQNGLLSSTDWTTFNGKQNALTNPVTGTGTTNYLPKFTGSTTIGNSQLFDNGTNVGIGTASPSTKLEIGGEASPIIRITSTSGPYSQIQSNTVGTLQLMADEGNTGSNTSMRFRVDGGEVMRLTGLNLLVGTTSDNGARLQVSGRLFVLNQVIANSTITDPTNDNTLTNGTVYALNGVSTNNNYGIGLSAVRNGNYDIWFQTGSVNGGGYRFYRGTTELVTITNSGNVGIGTTSPSNRLDVLGTAASPTLVGTNAYARFYQSGGYANVTIGALASGSFAGWIQTSDGVGTALPLSLQPSGANLLVGTTTDNGAKLQVSGDGYFSGNVGIGTSTPQSQLHLSSTAPIMSFTDINSFTDPLDRFMIRAGENQGNIQWYDDSAATTLNIMTFIESGNVGIGTDSPIAKLAVEGQAYFADDIVLRDGATASGDILVRIYDSSDDGIIDVYRNNSVVNRIHGNGSSYFNAGNVLIGTTTSGASKLRIVGLPTSASGLSSGDVWNDGGTLKMA